MNESFGLAFALIVGMLLGAIFFGGLWLTVRRSVASKHVALWFLGSMLLRTLIALLGFYFVSMGNWQRLLVALFGFVVARFIATRLTWFVEPSNHMGQEAGHAP